MQKISSKKIAQVVYSVSNVLDIDIDNISTDSRNIKKGSLFIAIKGENFDGHDFVEDVISKGADIVIVEKLLPNIPTIRQIVVSNSAQAYAQIGKYNKSFFDGKTIALTGSAGKTTTKEELKFVLSEFASTYASEGNFNNHIGVPKSLCDMNSDVDYAIFEVGMSSNGEISALVPYINPDIAIVTNVYPMHIEFFKDIQEIAQAKSEIFQGLSKDGVAIINEDTNCVEILLENAKKITKNIITYGKKNIISANELDGKTFLKALIGNQEIEFELANIGEHHIYNALCVLSVVNYLGLDLQKAAKILKYFKNPTGRGKKHELNLPDNKGKYTLIDDSYSGQPESMRLAIKSLADSKVLGRKIAVLGKMAELGKHSKDEHISVGKTLAKTDIKIVIAVCPETKDILAQLDDSFEKHYFENKDGVDEFLLNNILQDKDVMLIKGSRYSSSLYKTVESLIDLGGK